MTIRKRRSPAPAFRVPAPFNPTQGVHAPLGRNIDLTRVAMMQVLEDRGDYLLCRGYDPEAEVFLNQVSVAKPLVLQTTPWDAKTYTIDGKEAEFTYNEPEDDGLTISRTIEYSWNDGEAHSHTVEQTMSYPYFVGDILAAVKPKTKLGETPGVFDLDLYEEDMELTDLEVEIMCDEDEKPIAWMDLNVAGRGWSRPTDAIRRFELTANLSIGDTTTARKLEWDGDSFEVVGDEFDVYDPFSMFLQACKPKDEDGARGYARQYPEDAERWEIIELQHQARWIEFVVNDGSGFAASDASVTVDGVSYHDGYEPDTAITTVYNKTASSDYIFEGDDDDKGMAKYSPGTNKYIIDQMECP